MYDKGEGTWKQYSDLGRVWNLSGYTDTFDTMLVTYAKEVMFLGAFVCGDNYSKTNKWINLKCFVQIGPDLRNKWWHFGKDLDHTLDTIVSRRYTVLFSLNFQCFSLYVQHLLFTFPWLCPPPPPSRWHFTGGAWSAGFAAVGPLVTIGHMFGRFATVGLTLTQQWLANHSSVCISLEFATSGPTVDFYLRWWWAIIGDFVKLM